MYTIRATTDYAFDVTAQTEDFGMAEAIYRGLILTNCYAQVELEGKDRTVLRATYPLPIRCAACGAVDQHFTAEHGARR